MPLLVGILLALAVGIFGRIAGFDRDRAFYPTATIVVASYYVLFAVIGDSPNALYAELAAAALFVVAAVVGFRRSLWVAAAALTGHGIFDMAHARLITNPGLPTFWPPFCAAYDVVAGGFLAWLLLTNRAPVRP